LGAATMIQLRGDELPRLSVKGTLVIEAASAVPGDAGSHFRWRCSLRAPFPIGVRSDTVPIFPGRLKLAGLFESEMFSRVALRPRVQSVRSDREEPRIHESIQQAGARLVVEAPEPRRLGEGQTEPGHREILTLNTLDPAVNHDRVRT
jgi:hypothetical protein